MSRRHFPSRDHRERYQASPTLDIRIERLSLGGEGVGRAGGLVVFVPYAAPGDLLSVALIEQHARYARGRIVHILERAPVRVKPPCPYHYQAPEDGAANDARPIAQYPQAGSDLFCGGCSWQHLAYAGQLSAKREILRETLERVGGLRGTSVQPVRGMRDPWRYRNKVQEPVGWDGRRLISGFYAPGSHAIVPIDDCLVQPELSVAIINRARDLLSAHHVRAYDASSHQGWIRHLWVRTAGNPAKALLVFVSRTPDFPQEKLVVETLVREFPELVGIHQNVNPSRTNVILGRQWRKIAGADWIEEQLGALRFRLSPGSFFQVNTPQAEVLYNAVRELAGRGPRLLDLYCGVGGIALWLADQFEEVGGVEEFPEAIVDAEANAELNQIDNVRFMASSAERFLNGLDRRENHGLTVVMDPPRAGCTPEVLRAMARLAPPRIVYVSCDPGTLARDLAFLHENRYAIKTVQPVDLFPHTPHIETVVQLDRL